MRLLEATFATPAENLACDDVLLDLCEEGTGEEVLRFWTPKELFVVVGYTNAAAREVNLAACATAGVPLYRRTSGGGTVVQGPGCLNYSLILRQSRNSDLATIPGTNRFVLEVIAGTLGDLIHAPVSIRGHTDLVVGTRKVAGNSQRRRGNSILFHGTVLLGFDIGLIERFLPLPSTQPAYRRNRSHSEFLKNLGLSPPPVISALCNAWGANEDYGPLPAERIAALAAERYVNREWTFRR